MYNTNMYVFQPYFTNDGSVGLYSKDFNDIYHSATGALTESFEKFVYPISFDNLLLNDNINILDICYGIGYNTKAFLNYLYQNHKKLINRKNFVKKNFNNLDVSKNDIATVHTNNSSSTNSNSIYTNNRFDNKTKTCIDELHTNKIKLENYHTNTAPIYSDNIFDRVSVTALESDEILIGISPFIKTGSKKFAKDNEIINVHHLNKYFSNNKISHPKIDNLINFIIYQNILKNSPEIYQNHIITNILEASDFKDYFSSHFNEFLFSDYKNISHNHKRLNLHNIYYKYLTKSYKTILKCHNIGTINFIPNIGDARFYIKQNNTTYDLIFLDAFSPQKCPCLWSYEFFKELFRLLSPNGQLLTYSSSAAVRAAMKEAGFFIGYNYNKRLNKFDGTIAAKNKSLIKYPLSEFDLGLLKTTAGIFYRDDNLNAPNEAIIDNRVEEVKNSRRMSSTQYLKHHKNIQ